MSVMQLKHLFCNGVWGVYGPNHKPANVCWKWLVMLNEGGGPVNLTIGWYRKDYQAKWKIKHRMWFYVYAFGYKWHIDRK